MGAKAEELLWRLPGYNQVTGHVTPSGDLVLYLQHSNTMDNAAAVHLPDGYRAFNAEGEDVDRRIAFHDDPSDAERLERLNTGGDW